MKPKTPRTPTSPSPGKTRSSKVYSSPTKTPKQARSTIPNATSRSHDENLKPTLQLITTALLPVLLESLKRIDFHLTNIIQGSNSEDLKCIIESLPTAVQSWMNSPQQGGGSTQILDAIAKKASPGEIINVLVLMLQAAVRGPSKGECVEQIQHLSTSIQLWIMHIIKKAENNPEGGPQSDIELLVEVRFGQIMAETESLGVENESLRSEISRLRDQLKENSEYCELFNEAERALGEARAEKESFKKFNAERDEVIAGLEVRLNNVLGEKESLEGENRSLQKKIEQLAAGAQSLLKEYDEAMEDESTKIKDGDIALGNLKQELADLRSEHEQKILEAVEEARDNLINQHTLEMPKSNDKKDRLLCLMTNLCLEYRALRCRLQKVTSSEVAALLSTREPIKGADEAEIHDAIEHYLEREADCSSPVGTMLDSLPIAGHGSTESTPASPTVPSDSPSTSGVIEARSPEGDGASLSGHVGNSLDSEMLDWSPQNTNSELDPTQSPVMQECEASESTPVLDVTNGVPMEECARSPSLAGDVLFTGHAQKSIPRGLASAPAGSEDTSQPPTPHRYTPPTRTLLPSEADKKFGKHQGPSTDTTADNSGPISPLTTHGNDGSKLPINSIESTLASTASPINTVRPRVEDTVANGHDASSTSIIPGPEVDNTVSSAGPHMDSMDVTEKEDPLPKSVGGFGGVEVLVASPGPRVSSPGKWVEPATLGLSTESLPLAPTDSHDVSPIPPTPNGRNSKNGSDNTSMTPPSNCHAVSGEDNEAAPGSEELTHDFSQPLPSAHTTQKGLPHDTSTGGSSNADRPRASEQTADRQLRWDSQQAVIPPKAKKVTRHANLIAQQNLPGSDDSCDDCSSHHSSADARTPHASELVSDRVTAVNNPHAFESKYGLTVHQVQFVIDCADNRELFRRDLSTFLRDNYPLWRRSGIWCREQYHIPTSKRERHQNPTSQSDRARRIRALLGVEKKCDDDTVLRKLFAAHLALVEYESLLESFQHSIPRVSMPDSAAIDMIVEGQMVRRESVKRQLKVSRYLKRITDELGLGILLTGGSYLWTLIQGKNMTHGMWDCLAFHVTEEFPHFKAIAGLLEGIAKIFANEALDRLPTPEDFEVILKKVQDLEVTNDSRPSDDDSFEMQSSTNDFVDDDPRKTFKCSNRAGGDLLNDSSSSPLEKDVTTPIIIPVCHKSASPFAASAAADQLMSMAETDSSPPTKPYLTPRRTPKSARLTGRLASPDSLTATASKQFRSTPGTVNEDSTMTPSLPTPCPVSKRRYNGSETGPKKRRRVQSPPPNRSLKHALTLPQEPPPKRQRLEKRWFEMNKDKPWSQPLVYPFRSKNQATVKFQDLKTLDEGEWINDEIVNFYLRYLVCRLEESRPDIAKRLHIFNSFFYETLTRNTNGTRINYEAVRKWVKEDDDLFTSDYVIVPVHENSHWYVMIVCNLPMLKQKADWGNADADASCRPMIVTLDSLGLSHNSTTRNLREYLVSEGGKHSLCLEPSDISSMAAQGIPQQDNSFDCGVYILDYVEQVIKEIVQNPQDLVDRLFRTNPSQDKRWPSLDGSKKRDCIRDTILKERQETGADSSETEPPAVNITTPKARTTSTVHFHTPTASTSFAQMPDSPFTGQGKIGGACSTIGSEIFAEVGIQPMSAPPSFRDGFVEATEVVSSRMMGPAGILAETSNENIQSTSEGVEVAAEGNNPLSPYITCDQTNSPGREPPTTIQHPADEDGHNPAACKDQGASTNSSTSQTYVLQSEGELPWEHSSPQSTDHTNFQREDCSPQPSANATGEEGWDQGRSALDLQSWFEPAGGYTLEGWDDQVEQILDLESWLRAGEDVLSEPGSI